MKGVFQATGLLGAVVLLTTCLVSSGRQEDIQSILTALADSRDLNNVNITARETNRVYSTFNPASELWNSNVQLNKDLREALKNSVRETGTVTNLRTWTYKFRQEGVLTSNAGFDPRTKLIEEVTLVSTKEVFKLCALGRELILRHGYAIYFTPSSNLIFSKWDQIFKDPMTTMAAVDRFVHHAIILEFDGESMRAPRPTKEKVRGDANPYDPKYTQYFTRRRLWLWRTLWSNPDPAWSPKSLDA